MINTMSIILISMLVPVIAILVILAFRHRKLRKALEESCLTEKRLKEENHRYETLLVHQSRQAAMGEMIGNIAHQWKQPLNTLMLVIANLEDAYMYDDLDKEYFNSMIDKSRKLINQMSDTIDDFRHFFNPVDEKEAFKPFETIKSILFLLEENFRINDINVIFLEQDENLISSGYKNQYSQAIFNIINNSIDALNSKDILDKRIHIKVYEKRNMVVCEILDNAGGAPEEILSRIFDIYVTTKGKEEGTGLGLYIARTIVERNLKGEIECSNDKDGLKTVVSIPKESEEI